MFDSTGILEVFCQRISISNAASVTRDRFVVCVFVMERFDWMGEDAVCVDFSLDDGPTEAVECVLRPGQEDIIPPKPRAEDELQFCDGCFEAHRRLELSSATLQPGMRRLATSEVLS